MIIRTTRFGSVEFHPEDILLFPQGLIGFESFRHWILTADADNESIAWLQNIAKPDIALAVVSPRRFVPEYNVHVLGQQLESLQLTTVSAAYVLVVLSRNEHSLTINLRAPLLINLDKRLGKQLLTTDEQPIQHVVADVSLTLRKTA